MGKIAQNGILGGKRITLDKLERRSFASTRLVNSLLSTAGFSELAEKIWAREDLEVSEVQSLLERAPLPILMKLVELAPRARTSTEPQAIMFLPCQLLIAEHGFEVATKDLVDTINSLDLPHIRLVLDHLDFNRQPEFDQFLKQLSTCRENLTQVAPSVEQLLSQVLADNAPAANKITPVAALQSMLRQMHDLGVTQLRPSCHTSSLDVLAATGFAQAVITPIDVFCDPGLLAQELVELNKLARQTQAIGVWMPGELRASGVMRKRNPAQETELLRVLAVGALTLTAVPAIRASSRFLSLEALRMALYLGANDLGYGAVDDHTYRVLGLERLARLRRAFMAGAGE